MTGFNAAAKRYRALADPVRLRILSLLIDCDCTCICNLAKAVKRDISVVSRHVRQLQESGLITTRKDARFLYCCVKDKALARRLLGG